MVKFALTDFYASAVLAAPQRVMLAPLVVTSRKKHSSSFYSEPCALCASFSLSRYGYFF
jgi:hypothetical protein